MKYMYIVNVIMFTKVNLMVRVVFWVVLTCFENCNSLSVLNHIVAGHGC